MVDVKNRIRYLRESRGLTQGELCKKLNIAQSTLAKYESGTRKPDISMISKLSNFFEISTDFLLGNIQEDSSSENRKFSNDLKRILAEKTVTFDGEVMSDDEKALIEQMLTKMYSKAKEFDKQKS